MGLFSFLKFKTRTPALGQYSATTVDIFEIGPHPKTNGKVDLCRERPYFIVPLFELDEKAPRSDPFKQLRKTMRKQIADYVYSQQNRPQSFLLRWGEDLGQTPTVISDLTDPAGFIARLQVSTTATDTYFVSLFSPSLQRMIMLHRGATITDTLHIHLIEEINKCLQSTCFYKATAFSNTNLDATLVQNLQDPDLEGDALLEANRALLEAAFPKDISSYQNSTKGKITDIYIFSHGWHRNFYAAIAAYDRLISRFAILVHRRRLKVPQPYNPIFIALHWHSDPGPDGWASRSGGRSRESFLAKSAQFFENPDEMQIVQGPNECFKNVFEDIFYLMNEAATAPDLELRQSRDFQVRAEALASRLTTFRIKDAPQATFEEKVATAWTCYFEADPEDIHLNQDARPARFNTFVESIVTFFKFFASIVGIAFLLTIFLRIDSNVWRAPISWFWRTIQFLFNWIYYVPVLNSVVRSMVDAGENIIKLTRPLPWLLPSTLLLCLLVLLPIVILRLSAHYQQEIRAKHRVAKTPWIAVLAWIPLQILFTLPILLVTIVTYFVFGQIANLLSKFGIKNICCIYPERLGKRNVDPVKPMPNKCVQRLHKFKYVSSILASFARLPLTWLDLACPLDSGIRKLSGQIDYQLAFWAMQKRGTQAGGAAARFFFNLYSDPEFQESAGDARVHCIGHSFGALLTANMVRHQILDSSDPLKAGGDVMPLYKRMFVHSVCLIQGALACDWFDGEKTIVEGNKLTRGVQSVIACVYSRYDTANGFFYPLTNFARCAAGFRGLFQQERSVQFTVPPAGEVTGGIRNLAKFSYGAATTLVQSESGPQTPTLINVDASTTIHDGPISLGGGHDDIFKDEVLEIIWHVTQI